MSFTYDGSRNDHRQDQLIVLHSEKGNLSIALAIDGNISRQADLYVVPSDTDAPTEELFCVADMLVDCSDTNSYIYIDENDVRHAFPQGSFVKMTTFCIQITETSPENDIEEQIQKLDLSDCEGVIVGFRTPGSVSLSVVSGITEIIRQHVPEAPFIWRITFDNQCERIQTTALFGFPREHSFAGPNPLGLSCRTIPVRM